MIPSDSRFVRELDAVVQKYTELADHLLKSDSAVATDESDCDFTEGEKAS